MTLVLLDVDGTLVNAGGAGRWALERAFETVFALGDVSPLAGRVRFDGRTDPLIIADIAAAAGVAPGRLAPRTADLEAAYLAFLEERLAKPGTSRPLPGVPELLETMSLRSIPFGLLTGNIERGARLKLRAAGIERRFEAGAFGSDGPDRASLGRLARERFEALLDRRIRPEEVAVVGDSVEDVRAARANGYRCLAVATGWTEAAVLAEEGPDVIFPDLSGTEEVLGWISSPR